MPKENPLLPNFSKHKHLNKFISPKCSLKEEQASRFRDLCDELGITPWDINDPNGQWMKLSLHLIKRLKGFRHSKMRPGAPSKIDEMFTTYSDFMQNAPHLAFAEFLKEDNLRLKKKKPTAKTRIIEDMKKKNKYNITEAGIKKRVQKIEKMKEEEPLQFAEKMFGLPDPEEQTLKKSTPSLSKKRSRKKKK